MATVLWIDDDPAILELHGTLLRSKGYEVFTAPDGISGIAITRQRHIDVVVLDINMPGMDGLEVCHRLLAASPGIRVLMVTGRDSEEDPLRAAAVGARGLLTKPISLATLRDEILRALAN